MILACLGQALKKLITNRKSNLFPSVISCIINFSQIFLTLWFFGYKCANPFMAIVLQKGLTVLVLIFKKKKKIFWKLGRSIKAKWVSETSQ